MEIKDAYDAYWFIHDHPNSVQIDSDHPLVNFDEYEFAGIKVIDSDERMLVREGKPRDAEYERGRAEHADKDEWRGQFINSLDIMYVKVDPKTNSITQTDKDTQIRVWLETGPAYFEHYSGQYQSNMHDTKLDCGGATFEEALIKLAHLIQKEYGDYDSKQV